MSGSQIIIKSKDVITWEFNNGYKTRINSLSKLSNLIDYKIKNVSKSQNIVHKKDISEGAQNCRIRLHLALSYLGEPRADIRTYYMGCPVSYSPLI